jgi:hypothetical protein
MWILLAQIKKKKKLITKTRKQIFRNDLYQTNWQKKMKNNMIIGVYLTWDEVQ